MRESSGLASMAWRNLWRNRRRTAVTLSSITFGILLAVLFTGIGDSTYGGMIDMAASTGNGHVTLQHPGYLEAPAVKRSIVDANQLIETSLAEPGVTGAVPRITGQVMLATARESTGAAFIAIDPKADTVDTFSVLEAIDEGALFERSDSKGIILGRRLAEFLGVKMGKKVVYTLTDKSGEIVTGLARVTGIITTNAPSLDRGLCLLPIDTLREVIGYADDEVTQVAVFINDQRRSSDVAQRLGENVGPEAAALAWSETQPDLAGFVSMKMSSTVFLELVIALLVAAGIFNTMFVNVMERTRELGIMMAIGFSPRNVFSLIMWESLWLALVGIVAGVVVTALPYYYFATEGLDLTAVFGTEMEVAGVAMEPILYVAIYPQSATFIGLAVLLATLLSGLYPAWRAGRIVPVESIKLV